MLNHLQLSIGSTGDTILASVLMMTVGLGVIVGVVVALVRSRGRRASKASPQTSMTTSDLAPDSPPASQEQPWTSPGPWTPAPHPDAGPVQLETHLWQLGPDAMRPERPDDASA